MGQGSSWTFLPRSLAEEQPGISGCLPLLGGRGVGESPRGLLHHHDPSHPVDPEPCVCRLRQELCSLAGEVLPRSTDKLFGGESIRMHTCMRCPNKYPWLNDPTGDGIL